MPKRHLVILPFLWLAGCAGSVAPETFPDDFGVAVRHNMAAQIVAPERQVTTIAPAPGSRRSLAVERYQNDQVEPPVAIYTRDE